MSTKMIIILIKLNKMNFYCCLKGGRVLIKRKPINIRIHSMTVTIFHNPRCSKSRQTLALLEGKGISPIIREYLKDVPTFAELDELLNILGLEPRELMRKKEAEYEAAGLNDETLNRDQLIKGMIVNPKLIERPIVIKEGEARIGRPPETVLEIL